MAFNNEITARDEKNKLARLANRLHYAFYPSRAIIFGTRTNFTRTRTTFSEGPSTGEILVRHG